MLNKRNSKKYSEMKCYTRNVDNPEKHNLGAFGKSRYKNKKGAKK